MATANEDRQQYSNASSKTSFDLEPNPFEQSFANKDQKPPNIGNATSPQILTPGGRKLPPLVLSPNAPSSWGSTQFPRTGLTPNESSLRTGLTPGGANFPHSLNNLVSGLNTPGALAGFTGFTPGLSSLLGTNTKEFDQQAQTQAPPVIANGPPPSDAGVRDATARAQQAQHQSHQQAPPSQPSQPRSAMSNGEGSTRATTATTAAPPSQASSESKAKSPQQTKKSKRKSTASKKEEEATRKKPKPETKDSSPEELNEENMTEEEKRRSFLERNRVAASKCRQRKKQQIQKMETDLNFYLNEYNNLTAALDSLKEQSSALRSHLVAKANNPEIIGSIDNILGTINQTNYMSRLRGDNPSNIIPTVQPINPTLVQQNQQRVGTTLPQMPIPPQPVQNIPGAVPVVNGAVPDGAQMIAPNGQPMVPVVNGNGKVMMDWGQGA
ncbi:CYFA0S09e01442g1_1 [Cyberlindnera fabianii]|uniref:CYFA0S09e01442g1_1 n=1 Tax=Cyberlindnera fabianii TaxID=36022 RepID=A0A061AYL9_CYBFA|nr:Transcription factor atf1 [Cyberlindnera fabianii]CDR42337.1 CYFA0S09e01442g1_1 [Cyberlindnera fabianii]